MTTFPEIPGTDLPSGLTLSNPSGTRIPVDKGSLTRFLHTIEQHENVRFHSIELVFVNEKKIVDINREFLGRSYVTDILSFRYDEDESRNAIEGTLFCCAPRISEQSREEGTPEQEEFYRIFIHGLLHLAGYNDTTPEEKQAMTRLENRYLQLQDP